MCKENKKTIKDIPIFDNNTGKLNKLYTLVNTIRRNKDVLDEETIALLNQYGMTWGRETPDLNTIVENELIPWCKENNATIAEIENASTTGPTPPDEFLKH